MPFEPNYQKMYTILVAAVRDSMLILPEHHTVALLLSGAQKLTEEMYLADTEPDAEPCATPGVIILKEHIARTVGAI